MDNNFVLFFLAVLFAMIMLVEGVAILGLKKKITPLPARILAGLSALVAGSAKSQPRFSVKITPKGLRDYGRWVSVFGTLVLVSSLVFLFTAVI